MKNRIFYILAWGFVLMGLMGCTSKMFSNNLVMTKPDNTLWLDVTSCIDEPCFVNASKSSDSEYYIIVANPGTKYLLRSEP